MEISPLTRKVQPAALTAEQLASNAQLSEPEKIGQLCRQFEAVLLRQILRQANETVIKSSFTEDSAVSGMYQDMATYQLAESISQSGAFGLAKTLQQQLTEQLSSSKK